MTLFTRAPAFRPLFRVVINSLFVVGLIHAVAPSAGAVVMGTATISTTQTSAPYTYSLTLQNTGTLPIDTFWFAWLDNPELDFMTVAPTNIQFPANWVGLTSHQAGADGYGVEYYAFGGGLAPGSTLTGFKFVSTESPSQLMGNVSVPGVGTLPVTTTFLYNGGAFTANVAEIKTTVVPRAFDHRARRARQPGVVVRLATLGPSALVGPARTKVRVGASPLYRSRQAAILAAPWRERHSSFQARANVTLLSHRALTPVTPSNRLYLPVSRALANCLIRGRRRCGLRG